MSKEVMRQALEALELSAVTVDSFGVQQKTQEAITALREALTEQPAIKQDLTPEQPAQQEQEPVARLKEEWNNLDPVDPLRGLLSDAIDALAQHRAQRPWVGLSDEETEHLWEISRAAMPRYHTFKTLIEKALRERNT